MLLTRRKRKEQKRSQSIWIIWPYLKYKTEILGNNNWL
jgi:hypothetical protein